METSDNYSASRASELCNQSTASSTRASTILVDLLINYGNGTLKWYNETIIPSGWNAYTLTMYVTNCNVQSEYYGPPLNEHLVTGINGVSEHGTLTWNIWTFCLNERAWSYSQVGADLIHLTNGQVLAWVYETASTNMPRPPVPGARTILSC